MADEEQEVEAPVEGKPRIVSVDNKPVEQKQEVYKTLTPKQQAVVNVESLRGRALAAVRREVNTPRHIERYSERLGSSALGAAREILGGRKNEKGEVVHERTGAAAYVLGKTDTFKYSKASKGTKKGKGAKRGSFRSRYVASQQLGGRYSDRVINPSRRRVGPQSESAYNDNLPQHFGATVDWRATTSARLFDVYAVGSPVAKYGGGLPRFWDKRQGVQVKRNGMFGKGVFG